MFKTFLAGMAVAGAAGFYLVAYPLMTADKMRTAIEARDGATVVALIDFESLKGDLEADLMAAMSAEEKNPMALAFGGAMVSGMISGFVRPEIVENMVEGAGQSGRHASAVSAPAIPQIKDSSVRFGLGTMTVRIETEREPIDIVFAPRGLGWKVVGIDLDMGRLSR